MEELKDKLPKYLFLVGVVAIIIVVAVVLVIVFRSGNDEEKIEGYAKLLEQKDETYTFVSDKNKITTYTGYSDMSDFYYGVTCVSKNTQENQYFSEDALIDMSEKIIVDYGVYSNITQVTNGKYYKVEKDNLYGIIDYKGNIIIPVKYEYITTTNIQDEKEYVFTCEKENEEYDYINESGKLLMTSQGLSSSNNISYFDKFNDEYNTVVSIEDENNTRYFNLVSGEELFKDEENLNFKYNMQIKDKKAIIYNKDMSIKEEIDLSSSYSIDTEMYYNKYIVLAEMTLSDGKRNGMYTVYDENYNKIFSSKSKVYLLEDDDSKIYFLVNEDEGLSVYNVKGLVTKIKGYTYTFEYNVNSKFLPAKRLAEEKYDIFDFKGNIILEDISSYKYIEDLFIVTKSENDVDVDYILFDKDKKVAMEAMDNVVCDKYVILENIENKVISVYNMKGKNVIEEITGVKESYNDKYIVVKNDNIYTIYNINNGEKLFEYSEDNFVSEVEGFDIIELKDGYYDYTGKKLVEKN